MAGNAAGGKKAAATNKLRYGPGFYKGIGALGGTKSRGGGFANNPELAREAGAKGGRKSRGGGRRLHERVEMHLEDRRFYEAESSYAKALKEKKG